MQSCMQSCNQIRDGILKEQGYLQPNPLPGVEARLPSEKPYLTTEHEEKGIRGDGG